jgi:hypothetical protein
MPAMLPLGRSQPLELAPLEVAAGHRYEVEITAAGPESTHARRPDDVEAFDASGQRPVDAAQIVIDRRLSRNRQHPRKSAQSGASPAGEGDCEDPSGCSDGLRPASDGDGWCSR